jgi:L,D-transpeptidase catalytic domain
MRRRLIASLIGALLALPLCALPAAARLLIQIDKSAQLMTVSEDGTFLYRWPVSTGIARYDTPGGVYKPFRMEIDHRSDEWDDAPMPYSIFFTTKGHAIHGTTHKSIGRPASHGCVRLSVQNAATLWKLVKKAKMANTEVVLSGQIPRAPLVAEGAEQAPPLPPPEDLTASVTPRYQRQWSNDPAYYEENGRRYDDDRPPPPPADLPPPRLPGDDSNGESLLPFPFSLFGR